MAIVWVRRKTVQGSAVEDKGQQTFHSEYTVKSDNPLELRSAILACGLVPVYGAPHPENLSAVCTRVDAKRNPQSSYLWDVVADWQQNPGSKRDPTDQQKQPDQRRPKWNLNSIKIPYCPFVDQAGKLLATSAGQPFDPAMEYPIIGTEITVQRYEPSCPWATINAFTNKTNSEIWNGLPVGTVLIDAIQASDEYIQGQYWFPFTYKLIVKPRYTMTLPKGSEVTVGGWDPEYIPDIGTLQFAEVDGKTVLVPIVRTDPTDSTKKWYDGRPAFLDGAGKELARNESTGMYDADPVFVPFTLKDKTDYTSLLLTPPDGMTF